MQLPFAATPSPGVGKVTVFALAAITILVALGVSAAAATVVASARDGYRQVPVRRA